MSSDCASHELLTRAFVGFERAAANLEQGHAALRGEIARLEGELLDAHRRLEAVLDALDTGVVVFSERDGVLRANRAFHVLGFDTSADGGLDAALSAFARESGSRGGTARLRRTTGGVERDLAVTVTPVGDAEATRVLTVQDVTEIRREEEEGGRRRRLEAMGRMAAELAHEVRNPLGSIRLFAGMLHEDLTDRASLREMAEQILKASSSLEGTVSNLLAFASPSRADRKRTDLRAVADDVCVLLAPTCRARGVRLDGPPSPLPCPVEADPEGMRQVVLNLLGNALAATGEGGRVGVNVARDEDRAVLRVEDTGRGIAPEDLPRVFDPFFSRTEGGTGLGLSVVHGIVERHGGTIALDSKIDRGTRVRVEIPAAPVREKLDD